MMHSPKYVKGQSIAEFIVAFAILLPLLYMLPTLANMLSVQTEAHKAGRYVAWERTAYATADLPTALDMSQDVETRFFANPESSFGNSGQSTFRPPWRDFKNPDVSVLDLSRQSIVIDRDDARSATDGSQNASAWLANKGTGANQVELDTLQVSRISVPINSNISLYKANRPGSLTFGEWDIGMQERAPERDPTRPYDPVAGVYRFNVASSSALVSDSWSPANEQMYRSRVADMNRSAGNFQRHFEGLLSAPLIRNTFDELSDHLYVGSPINESYNMVDSNQSVVLPSNLKEYSEP